MFFLPLLGAAGGVSLLRSKSKWKREAKEAKLELAREKKKDDKTNNFATVDYLSNVKDQLKDLSEQNEKLAKQLKMMQQLEAQQAAMATMRGRNHFQRIGQPFAMPPHGQQPAFNDPFRGLNTQFMPNFGLNSGGALS